MTESKAHPQINPLSFEQSPESLVGKLSPALLNVYSIVWKGSAACLADEPILKLNQITYQLDKNIFLMLVGMKIDEQGWLVFDSRPLEELRAVVTATIEEVNKFYHISNISLKDALIVEHQTEPPENYSCADLIELMVSQNFARPSTYASSIDRLLHSKGEPFAYLNNKKIHLSKKSFDILRYLEKEFPSIRFDAKFSSQIEQDLDEIAGGAVKASEVIKKHIIDIIPELNAIKDAWWIDTLIGDEPEELTLSQDELEKQEIHIPLKMLDVNCYLKQTDPYRLLKSALDACITKVNQDLLNSTQYESQCRIVKASVMQQLLDIDSSQVFLTELRFNYILQWIVGFEPLHEIWKVTLYDRLRHEIVVIDLATKILNEFNEDLDMRKLIKKFGLHLKSQD